MVAHERMQPNLPEIYSPADWESLNELCSNAAMANDEIYKEFTKSKSVLYDFPDEFAGTYIGDDYMLHVMLTDLAFTEKYIDLAGVATCN